MKDIRYRRRIWQLIVAILLCVCTVPMFGKKVEAAKTCSSVISYPGKTKAQVNIRKKGGTTYKSYGMLKANQSVTILGQVTNKGVKWYKCKTKINDKTVTGYVCATYIETVFPKDGVVNSKVLTTLNVRKSAKASSKSLAKIKKDQKVVIKSFTKKSSTYWYKVDVKVNKKTITGYVSGKYISVVGNNKSTTSSTTATTTQKTESTTQKKTQRGYVNDKVNSYLNVRKEANANCTILMRIPPKTEMDILGTSGDWYQVKVTYDGKTVTGYVSKQYVSIKTEEKTTQSSTTEATTESSVDYETALKEFPESYQTKIKELHKSYPKWKFVAMNTKLDWSNVIQNESVVGRNVIQSNYPKGTNSLAPFSYLSTAEGAYDWSTDKYVVKDGSNWYCANSTVISYYMDPRNFINATDIFQFEALAYDESQSADVVQSILSNTFMKGDYKVKDSATGKTVSGSYKDAFMAAGKNAKANPYFLATRVKQEVGVNGSNSTSGTYKGYEGLYNFYNIGANDGANAVANGLNWANGGSAKATTYGRPWTTPYKSIVGGAQYIAANYINKGQDTLYFQKFNVRPTDSKQLFLHQYMTNVQAPYSEGKTTRGAYSSLGILSDSMVFYIPVYSNMPATPCSLPATSGNPNPFLASLQVTSGNTNLSFDSTFVKPSAKGVLAKDTYSVAVAKGVSSVNVSAKTISSKASVNGTGTITLKEPGETTTVKVTGVAQNGTKKEYTINIIRNTK